MVDEPVRVGLHAIRDAGLGVLVYCSLREDLAVLVVGEQIRGRDGVEVALRDGFPVERATVGAESDAVGAESHVPDFVAVLVRGVEWYAPDVGDELVALVRDGKAIEVPPGLPCAQVDDDDPVAAFGGAVGDVGDALAARSEFGAQVEADVVEVGVAVCDCGWEDDGLEDLVVGEVYTDELGPAIDGVD